MIAGCNNAASASLTPALSLGALCGRIEKEPQSRLTRGKAQCPTQRPTGWQFAGFQLASFQLASFQLALTGP